MLQKFFIFMVLTGVFFSSVNTLYSNDVTMTHGTEHVSGLLHEYYKEFHKPSSTHKNCNCASSQTPVNNVLGNYYSELLK